MCRSSIFHVPRFFFLWCSGFCEGNESGFLLISCQYSLCLELPCSEWGSHLKWLQNDANDERSQGWDQRVNPLRIHAPRPHQCGLFTLGEKKFPHSLWYILRFDCFDYEVRLISIMSSFPEWFKSCRLLTCSENEPTRVSVFHSIFSAPRKSFAPTASNCMWTDV